MNGVSIMQYGVPIVIMQYGIPIVAIIGIIGVVLLAIVAIKLISKFISFAIQYLSLGISLYRLTRSKYVSQELREKMHPLIVDHIIIAAAHLGSAIFIAIFMLGMVTGAPYLVFVISICAIALLITFNLRMTCKSEEHNAAFKKELQAGHCDEPADADGYCQDGSTDA